MFKKIVVSPRWYGMQIIIPAAGLPIGTYPTGIVIPQGANFVWIRSNVTPLIGNSPASILAYGNILDPVAYGAEGEPSFAFTNLLLGAANSFNNTEIVISVIGDGITSGIFNLAMQVVETH